jgi:hypothetical protein
MTSESETPGPGLPNLTFHSAGPDDSDQAKFKFRTELSNHVMARMAKENRNTHQGDEMYFESV